MVSVFNSKDLINSWSAVKFFRSHENCAEQTRDTAKSLWELVVRLSALQGNMAAVELKKNLPNPTSCDCFCVWFQILDNFLVRHRVFPLAPILRWTNMKCCKKFMKVSYSLVCIAGRHDCSRTEENDVKTNELWLFLCSIPKTWQFLGPPSSLSARMKIALNKLAALQKVCFMVCISCAQWLSGGLQLK